jgi:hypothetical protein
MNWGRQPAKGGLTAVVRAREEPANNSLLDVDTPSLGSRARTFAFPRHWDRLLALVKAGN